MHTPTQDEVYERRYTSGCSLLLWSRLPCPSIEDDELVFKHDVGPSEFAVAARALLRGIDTKPPDAAARTLALAAGQLVGAGRFALLDWFRSGDFGNPDEY